MAALQYSAQDLIKTTIDCDYVNNQDFTILLAVTECNFQPGDIIL